MGSEAWGCGAQRTCKQGLGWGAKRGVWRLPPQCNRTWDHLGKSQAIPAHPETASSGSRVTNVPNQDLSVWGSHAIMFAEFVRHRLRNPTLNKETVHDMITTFRKAIR